MQVNQIRAGAALSYVSMALSTIISLVYTPIMLQQLGDSEFGVYQAVLPIISYLNLLSFGLGSAYVRYYSRFRAAGDREGCAKLNGMFLITYLILGAAVLAAAAIFAAVNYPAAVSASAATRQLPIYCVQRDQKVCSISFDAAWGADNTQKILDVLKEYGVTCTFFVVGNWADQYPEQAKAIVDSGNELMNHSNAHDHYNSLTADQIIADVNTCNDKIEALTGVRPTLIRCPFGEYDDHVISTIRSIGMEPIQWDVEALAAVGTARGASDMRAPYSSSCSGRCRSAGHSKKLIM